MLLQFGIQAIVVLLTACDVFTKAHQRLVHCLLQG
jgi:hypothetical protein